MPRYGLEMNTKSSRTAQGYKRHQNPRLLFPQIRKNYRADWIRVKCKYPNLSRRELVKKGENIYKWLRRNDSDWLEKHLPKSKKLGKIGEKLNWSQVDLELSEKVKNVCKEIEATKEVSVRISLAEIMRRVGNRVWIDKRHEKLPLTKKVIEKNLDSWEDFMLRKIEWGKEFFIKNNKLPALAQFKNKSSIRNQTSFNSPKVQKAVQDALNEIQFTLFS